MKITNSKQFEILVAELEKNPNLAKGFTRGIVSANFKEKWEEITLKIKAFGPPLRDSDGWQKVWRDLKFKTKKKIAQNEAECNATGGGRYKQLQLSTLEEAVADLMQFEKQLNPEGLMFGVESEAEPVPILEDEGSTGENAYPPQSSTGDSSVSKCSHTKTATPAKKSPKQTSAGKNERTQNF